LRRLHGLDLFGNLENAGHEDFALDVCGAGESAARQEQEEEAEYHMLIIGSGAGKHNANSGKVLQEKTEQNREDTKAEK
jgi:hypothetical protein